MAVVLGGLKTVSLRRLVTIVVATTMAATVFLICGRASLSTQITDYVRITNIHTLPNMFNTMPNHPGLPLSSPLGSSGLALGQCDPQNRTSALQRFKAAQNKYNALRDDKFTIAIQTYNRPKELNDTLRVLLTDKIPSLHEIVVVWNNVNEVPPQNFKSKHGVLVRYRASPRNSLNQRLVPDPEFKTKAILLSDDDVYYKPGDLEFVFQTWRQFGQYRLTGALPRCASPSAKEEETWNYNFCSREANKDVYSMIITNLAFSNIAFLDYYSSEDDPTMTEVRKYVDDHFNCEDIAMNFVTSFLTGTGPLLVQGHDQYVNYVPSTGISTKPGHMKARSKCLDVFTRLFGCMPLVNETGHIQRGVVLL